MGRLDKINEQIKRIISQGILQEFSDPRLEFVTITKVDVSPDLHNAKVSFSVLGDDSMLAGAQKSLDGARGAIRRLIAKQLAIRYIPELHFAFDKTIEASARIEETLREINSDESIDH